MKKINVKKFKYRGQKFIFAENEFDFVPGFRVKRDGFIFISLSSHLPLPKRNLEFHRLITKRGLRDIKIHERSLEFSL